MIVIALEASTSSAKAMLFDTHCGILGVESAEYAADICDTVTINPDAAVDSLLRCAADLLQKHGVKPEIIGLSSIWHSLLPLGKNREPLGRVRTWADTSPAQTVAKYKKDRDLCRKLYKKTGCAQHSIYNMWKWIDLKEKGQTGTEYLSSMGEYLFEKLTGEACISQTAAAGSAMMSAHTLDWDDEILSFAGVKPDMLSRITAPSYTAGLLERPARILGVAAGTPVVVTGADGGFNQIAAGGLREGVMTLSVGTSGAIRMGTPAPVLPDDPSTWCYYGDEGMFISGAATSGAGNCVQWFAKKIAATGDYALLDREAEASAQADAPYFLPFIFGERCPGWADERKGGFPDIGPACTRGEMFYAVLEGILFNLYQNYETLYKIYGGAPCILSVSGGIIKSPFWMKMAADLFGLPLTLSETEHASLTGAVWMARKAAGDIESLKDIPVENGEIRTADSKARSFLLERYAKWTDYYNK